MSGKKCDVKRCKIESPNDLPNQTRLSDAMFFILVPEHLDDFHRATKLNLGHCPLGLMRFPSQKKSNRSIKGL